VSLDGLADRLRAAIKKHEAGESPDSLSASEGGQYSGGERRANCLEERMRRAQERLERMQDQDSIL
jgi:hypothetical protein